MSFSSGRHSSSHSATDPTARHPRATADENDSFGTQEALSDQGTPLNAQAQLCRPLSGPNKDGADETGDTEELRAQLQEARQQVAHLHHLQEETAAKLGAADARSPVERMSSGALLTVSPSTQSNPPTRTHSGSDEPPSGTSQVQGYSGDTNATLLPLDLSVHRTSLTRG